MRIRQFARHVLRSFGSGASSVAVAFLMTLSVISMPVQACSCQEAGDWGFIGPQDGRIPANSVGIAWFSTHGGRAHPALEERFTVEIWDGSVFRPLSVAVNPVGGYTGLYVVAPEGERMRRGATYRFTTTGELDEYSEGNRQVLVTVDHEELAEDTPLTLEVGPVTRDSIRVSAWGSCSTELRAAQVSVRAEPGQSAQSWRDQLLYRTLIDGWQLWFPTRSACATVPYGRSWEAVGLDRVYAACESSINGDTGLLRGPHTIKMQAILPGTNVVLESPSETVELDCSILDRLRFEWQHILERLGE